MTFFAEFDMSIFVDVVLLTFLLMAAFAIVVMRHLFSVVMVGGVYSLVSAAFFVNLDAVDVAFTEAAVGGGISTVLLLGGLMLTSRREKLPVTRRSVIPLLAAVVTGSALIYATFDMPDFEDPDSPANAYVGRDYMERTPREIDVPNVVTAVLASYRGFDTMGETAVVFTAGLGVLVLLGMGLRVAPATDKEEDGT